MKRAVAVILAALLLIMQLLPATAEIYSDWYQVISDEIEAPEYHTVRFIADGEVISTIFVRDGGVIEDFPDAPEMDGKEFLGWYDADSFFTAETIISEEKDIEARYQEAQAAADFIFTSRTVYLKDIASALGISIANNSTLSVDHPLIHLSDTTVKNKNKDTITLTADGYFDHATLTIRKNKNSVQTVTLAYLETEEEEEEAVLVDGALYYNEHLYLTGKIPGNGIIDVTPVTVSIDGEEVLAAYDIKIYTNENQQKKGKNWQPAGKKVQVHFFDEAFTGEVNVYHIDGAAPEYVDTVTAENGWVAFEAESFSTYAVTRTIEKTVEIGGSTYHITVSYGKDACIPDGAELAVAEVGADAYLDQAAAALGLGAEDEFHYAKFLDISILYNGVEIEPKAPVDVTVSLLDMTEGAQALEVVHFANGAQASRVESNADGNGTVTFSTDSFSIFGFGSILRSLLSWTSGAVTYTLQGFSSLLNPTCTAVSVALEEGLEAVSAYHVQSTLGSLLNALYVKVSTALSLGDRESVIVYAVRDGQLSDILAEGGNVDESIALGDADGFAVVKDTGFRRKVFSLGAVELNGLLPKAAEAEAIAASPELEGEVLAAYDINIEENGDDYQPDADHPVEVSIAVGETTGDLHVFHILDDGTREEITDFTVEDGKVVFTAKGFSVYAVTEITTDFLASDGRNYHISVTFGPEAKIPNGSTLKVNEVLPDSAAYAGYIERIRNEVDWHEIVGYARFFDITILNGEEVIQPAAPVEVRIELATVFNEDVKAVHFGERAELLAASTPKAKNLDSAITFEARSFSVYGVFVSTSDRKLTNGEQYIIYTKDGMAIGANSNLTPVKVSESAGFVESPNDNVYWTAEYVRNHSTQGYAQYRLYYVSNGRKYYLTRSGTSLTVSNSLAAVSDSGTQLWSTYDVYMHNGETTNNFVRYNNGSFGMTDWNGKSVIRFAQKQDEIPTSIKVYVYVAREIDKKTHTLISDECLDLLGIDKSTLDGNNYFPAGEIELDISFLAGKGDAPTTPGAALIQTQQDWQMVLAALGDLNTSTLVYMEGTDYTKNRGNHVGEYLAQAIGDLQKSWGSQSTALFRWNDTISYGFEDQTVKYHLDLRFNTTKITFITGNNKINTGNAKDGTVVDSRTYIVGSKIQEPRNLTIPSGYKFMGYYTDPDFTTPWDGIGTPLNEDQTVYIKITKEENVVLHYRPVPGTYAGTLTLYEEALNPQNGKPTGSKATPNPGYRFDGWYADEACTQLLSHDAVFVPTKRSNERWIDGTTYYAKFVEDTVTLTFIAEEGVDHVERVTDAGDVISVSGDKTKNMTVTISKQNGPAVTVRGVAADGYVIKEWTIDGRNGALTTNESLTTKITDDLAATTQWTDRTYHVWAETAKTVTVEKEVKLLGTVTNSDINTTVYFVLWDIVANDNVRDEQGNILIKSINIVNGVPQGTVSFTDLQSGTYSVWEVDATGKDLAAGTVVIGNDIVVSKIETRHGTESGNRATVNDQNPTDTVAVINTYNHKSDVTSWTIKKEWYTTKNQVQSDQANKNIPAGATSTLVIYRKDDLDTPLQTVILDGNEDTPWVATFDGLQIKDANGQTIEYVVKETAFTPEKNEQGYFYPYSGETDHDGGTIRNAVINGSINVYKQIEVQPRSNEMNALIAAAVGNLKIRVTGPHGYNKDFIFTNVTDPYNPSLQITDLPAGEYTLEELDYEDLLTGRKWNPTLSWIKAGIGGEDSGKTSVIFEVATNGASNDSVDVRIKNDYTKYDITATKQWEDNGIENHDHPAVSLTLYRIDSDNNRSVVSTKIVPANATGEYLSVKWKQQEQQDQQYTYEIEEAPVEGYLCESITGDMFSGFTVTNVIAPQVNLTKAVTGNMADTGKKFTFTVSAKDASGRDASFKANGNDCTGSTTLTLAHGENAKLNFLIGTVVTITENPDGYTLTGACGAANGSLNAETKTYTFTMTAADEKQTITFTNDLSQTVDTGVRMSAAPYGMILALALLGGALVLRGRRRRGGVRK